MPPDEVLIATYCQVATPVDRILVDANLRAIFLAHLPVDYQTADSEAVAQRLVYLRKRGRLPGYSEHAEQERSRHEISYCLHPCLGRIRLFYAA